MSTNIVRAAVTSSAVLAGLFLASAPAAAQDAAAFAASAVSDAELGQIHGTYIPPRSVALFTDTQARDDFRQTASVGTLTFDNWFNDVGMALIYNNILARGR